ncbi:MAG: hypothetical protein U1D70_12160, partial [Methylobacter sp.]|nr:hypothetical protein [Methylobacter sp.]MDP2430390.1 hypothetical protein [Methylobacter sp.]MDP3055621.1 hypothetical protein [Methylobacter sp.]MDZ4219763.1 hypothetical protein [Methylobacter sp.]
GLPFRFQLLSTPFRNDAVTFRYDVMAYADRDFHPVDKLPLWAHERQAPAWRVPSMIDIAELGPQRSRLFVICPGLQG